MPRVLPYLLSAVFVAVLACGDGVSSLLEPPSFPRVSITLCEEDLDAIGASCLLGATVWDSAGHVIAGAPVTWSSGAPAIASVDADGRLTAHRNGTAVIRAMSGSIEGLVEVTVQQVAVSVIKVSGDVQSGAPGTLLPGPLVSKAIDRLGHPVGGTSVFYRVSLGTGILSSSSATTSAVGEASVRWTLGPEVGNQTVIASVRPGQLTPAQYTATAR